MDLQEGVVRTTSGLVADILDEYTDGTNDETADKVERSVGWLSGPRLHHSLCTQLGCRQI